MKKTGMAVVVLFLGLVLSAPTFAGKGGGSQSMKGRSSGDSGFMQKKQPSEQNRYQQRFENKDNQGLNEVKARKARYEEQIRNTERLNLQQERTSATE